MTQPRNLSPIASDLKESMGVKDHDSFARKDVIPLVEAAQEMVDKFARATLAERMRLAHNLEEALKPFSKQKGRQP